MALTELLLLQMLLIRSTRKFLYSFLSLQNRLSTSSVHKTPSDIGSIILLFRFLPSLMQDIELILPFYCRLQSELLQ